MVYIAKDTVENLSPGAILGDSKSVETRQLQIEIGSDGAPVDDWNDGEGRVVFVNENGYAKPFLENTTGKVPYGVVAKVNVKPDYEITYTNSPDYNTVLVVVSGVVGVAYNSELGGDEPVVGGLVNQFGGAYRPKTTDVPSNDVCIGVCDGIAPSSDNDSITPAVRVSVLRFGAATDAVHPSDPPVPPKPGDTITAHFERDTYKGAPLSIDGRFSDSSSNGEEYPIAVQITPEQCLRFEGFAADTYAAGTNGEVQVSGTIELPYFIPDTSNALDEPRIVRLMDDPNEDSWFVQTCNVIVAIGEFVSVVFGAVSKGRQMIKAIQKYRGSIVGRCTGNRLVSNPLGWVIDPKTNSPIRDDPEPVITGWITIDVDPQNDLSPTSLELGTVSDPQIGHIYGDSGKANLVEFTDNFMGIPFFGVCISNEPNMQGKVAFAHEGIVDVLAHQNWHAGDYIDYMRNPIPGMYEQYVARIGTALTDCAAGKMGAVELNPYDPNEYIILDHVTLMDAVSDSLNTSVYQVGRELYRCTPVPSIKYPDGNYISIRGVLRHYFANYVPPDDEGNAGRAIIQVGGYAWVDSTPALTRASCGRPVRALGPDWIDMILSEAVGEDMAFMQLGTAVSPLPIPHDSPSIIMVKLDIRHNPQLALPEPPQPVITGREDVRLNVKKVIPLTTDDAGKMAFVYPDDQKFTIEGLSYTIYSDNAWRDDIIDNITARDITTTALNLTMNGQSTRIIHGFEFGGTIGKHNELKIILNPNGLPDQWDDDESSPVVGYRIVITGFSTDAVYLSAPVYFIMNTTPNKTEKEEEVTNNA